MTQDTKIPKLMHFIWLGKPMPPHLRANVRSWEEMHPDWSVFIHTERTLGTLRNQALYDQAESLVPSDAVAQFRSDLMRYEVLFDRGGFYADVDTYPLKPVNEALSGHEVFAAAEDRNWVGNTYLGATSGHPLFAALIAGIPANVKRLRGKRPNHLTGPRYLTPLWRRYGGYVAPTHQFYPYSYTHVKAGTVPATFAQDVFSVHSWNHTREVLESRRV